MVSLFDRVEAEIGPVEVAVFNIGANSPMSLLDETERRYRKIWEMCALGGFFMAREAARRMVPRGRGTILFTGATASIRGSAGFAAFAGGKHALRESSAPRVFTSATSLSMVQSIQNSSGAGFPSAMLKRRMAEFWIPIISLPIM